MAYPYLLHDAVTVCWLIYLSNHIVTKIVIPNYRSAKQWAFPEDKTLNEKTRLLYSGDNMV